MERSNSNLVVNNEPKMVEAVQNLVYYGVLCSYNVLPLLLKQGSRAEALELIEGFTANQDPYNFERVELTEEQKITLLKMPDFEDIRGFALYCNQEPALCCKE